MKVAISIAANRLQAKGFRLEGFPAFLYDLQPVPCSLSTGIGKMLGVVILSRP
jgi:hypothetical protein